MGITYAVYANYVCCSIIIIIIIIKLYLMTDYIDYLI
jgi:uncharacterized membrane protein YpjA